MNHKLPSIYLTRYGQCRMQKHWFGLVGPSKHSIRFKTMVFEVYRDGSVMVYDGKGMDKFYQEAKPNPSTRPGYPNKVKFEPGEFNLLILEKDFIEIGSSLYPNLRVDIAIYRPNKPTTYKPV